MGGIWFWTVYGTGIGAAMVHRRSPEALDAVTPAAAASTATGRGFEVVAPHADDPR